MRSPFPGMDPYVEDPSVWPDLHQRLITYSCDTIQEQLPERYYARMGERLYVEGPGHEIGPDVVLKEIGPTRAGPARGSLVADLPVVLIEEEIEHREVYIEIRDSRTGDAVVTVIEILSPANKRPGVGRDLYLRKQREILDSGVHLVEIDLLRDGSPTASVSSRRQEMGLYRVVVRRAPDRLRRELYPFDLRSRLPRVGIPLVAPDPDVVLDLGAVFERAYAMGAFARTIDYSRAPKPALREEDVPWARERIEEWRRGGGNS